MAFTQTKVTLKGGTIPCFVSGEGRPLLFVHSSGGVRLTPGLEKLSKTHRIYMPLLPGFDGTPPDDRLRSMQDVGNLAADFIDSQIKEPCDVIGHSFGARAAAWLGILHPDKVQLLVLAAASIRPLGEQRPTGTHEDALRRLFVHPENLPPESKSPELLAQNRAISLRLRGTPEQDAELLTRLADIRALTLILYGTKDGEIPPSSAQFLKQRIPHAMLIYVHDAAHGIDTDQPDRFARVVSSFLTRGEGFIVNRGSQIDANLAP